MHLMIIHDNLFLYNKSIKKKYKIDYELNNQKTSFNNN